MQFYIISYTLFLFVMFIFFPSLTYAWTKNNPPIEPPTTMTNDCVHWIEYNGFKLDNHPFNRNKAKTRDHSLDKEASTWAAMYAFKIGGLKDNYQISPKEFCDSFDGENSDSMTFMSLEKEKKNCKSWIHLYGFQNTIYDNYNVDYVHNVDPTKVMFISIWAYSYYIYLMFCEEEERLTPSKLCNKMGSQGEHSTPKPFACKHDSLLTCIDWLDQYDYMTYDNPLHNAYQAELLRMEKMSYPLIHIHYFPSTYGREALDLVESGQQVDHLTQMEFCKKYDGEDDEPQKYPFDYPVAE